MKIMCFLEISDMQVKFFDQGVDEFIKAVGDFTNTSPTLESDETILRFSSQLGEGYMQKIPLRSGLDIMVESLAFKEQITLQTEYSEYFPRFEISFYVTGGNIAFIQGKSKSIEFSPGQCGLGFPYRSKGIMEYSAGQENIFITLYAEMSVLRDLINDQLKLLPKQLQQIIKGNEKSFYFRPYPATPTMKLAAEQILNCYCKGEIRRLYLEGKAIEMIALYLQRLSLETQETQETKNYPTLNSDGIEQMHQAKEVLLRDLVNPPSLVDLARRVGLNDFKLKWGFRKVFGTSVFRYLNDYRLVEAKRLIEQDNLSISEVANAVGFASHSYFSAIFKRKYGLSPRVYLTEIRSKGE